MKIAISKKSGKLIIDGEGATITLNPGYKGVLNLFNLKNVIVRNLKVNRNKISKRPMINAKNINNLLLKDSHFNGGK